MIKAVFFDIDGTLVSFQTHQIPKSTMTALQKLKEKGILLFIATGRAKDGLECLQDFPFDGYITLNGQFDFTADHQVIYENTINKEDLSVLINECNKDPFPCAYIMRDCRIFNFRDERVEEVNRITHNDAHPAGDVSDVLNQNIYQVMVFINEQQEKELLQKMPGCTSSRWYPSFCDISPKGGTKVRGMDCFAEKFHFSREETMAFGDGGNDMLMLQHAGISVAMGNSSDELKKIAEYVTDTVDNDGILKACIHYNLL